MTECQIIGTIMWQLRKWAQMSQTKTLMTSLSYYVTTRLPLCGGVVTGTFVSLSRYLLVMFGLSLKDESCTKNSALSQLQTPRASRNFCRCKPLECMHDHVFGRFDKDNDNLPGHRGEDLFERIFRGGRGGSKCSPFRNNRYRSTSDRLVLNINPDFYYCCSS